jgi:hypothetical protein
MSELFLDKNFVNKNLDNIGGNYNINTDFEKNGKVDNFVIIQVILVYVLVIIASFFYISMAANFDSSKNKWVFIFSLIVALIMSSVFLVLIQSGFSRTKLKSFGFSIKSFFSNLSNTQKVLLTIIFIIITILIFFILNKLTTQPSMGYIRVDGGNNNVYQISDPVTIIGYSTTNPNVFNMIWKGDWINQSDNKKGVIVPITLSNSYDKTINEKLPDINQFPNDIPKVFTYSMWLKIKPQSYLIQDNQYKVILIRGSIGNNDNINYFEGKQPGIYLDNSDNSLMINMGKQLDLTKNTRNQIRVSDLPLNKWFCLTIVVMNNSVDIFIDGLLLDTLTLINVIYENEGSLYLKSLGGFFGHLVYLRYINEALTPKLVYEYYMKEKLIIDDFVKKYETTTPEDMLIKNERLLAQSRENCKEKCN